MRALHHYFVIPIGEKFCVGFGFVGVFLVVWFFVGFLFVCLVLLPLQVRLFLQKAKDLYKAPGNSNSEVHGDQYTLED